MAILSSIQWPQKSFQFDWKAHKWSFQVWKAKVLVQSPSVKDLRGTSPVQASGQHGGLCSSLKAAENSHFTRALDCRLIRSLDSRGFYSLVISSQEPQ